MVECYAYNAVVKGWIPFMNNFLFIIVSDRINNKLLIHIFFLSFCSQIGECISKHNLEHNGREHFVQQYLESE